jgi:hypothetical protein
MPQACSRTKHPSGLTTGTADNNGRDGELEPPLGVPGVICVSLAGIAPELVDLHGAGVAVVQASACMAGRIKEWSRAHPEPVPHEYNPALQR